MLPLLLLALAGSTEALDRAEEALFSFEAGAAVGFLEQAQQQGPYTYADHVRLYEHLGVAHAYLKHQEEARAAFSMLLDLDPGHAISYTLSPKVTFIFQEARQQAQQRPRSEVQLSWPRELTVEDQVPVDVEVVADPRGFMKRALLYARRRGQGDYTSHALELGPVGSYRRVTLPPLARGAAAPDVLQLYLVVQDEQGNEVHLVGTPERPREIALAHEDPVPWYGHWWLWAAAGGVAALAAGAVVFALTYQPPDELGGRFEVVAAP